MLEDQAGKADHKFHQKSDTKSGWGLESEPTGYKLYLFLLSCYILHCLSLLSLNALTQLFRPQSDKQPGRLRSVHTIPGCICSSTESLFEASVSLWFNPFHSVSHCVDVMDTVSLVRFCIFSENLTRHWVPSNSIYLHPLKECVSIKNSLHQFAKYKSNTDDATPQKILLHVASKCSFAIYWKSNKCTITSFALAENCIFF